MQYLLDILDMVAVAESCFLADWVSMAHEYGWDVLLDAAAFAPTSRLDLGVHTPDYMVLSFYKMFGYPTGIGCLVVRRAALAKLAQR